MSEMLDVYRPGAGLLGQAVFEAVRKSVGARRETCTSARRSSHKRQWHRGRWMPRLLWTHVHVAQCGIRIVDSIGPASLYDSDFGCMEDGIAPRRRIVEAELLQALSTDTPCQYSFFLPDDLHLRHPRRNATDARLLSVVNEAIPTATGLGNVADDDCISTVVLSLFKPGRGACLPPTRYHVGAKEPQLG
ncbi:hypothetical protein BKA80DRAFT_300774 [Phyllosticta citrichinensis]